MPRACRPAAAPKVHPRSGEAAWSRVRFLRALGAARRSLVAPALAVGCLAACGAAEPETRGPLSVLVGPLPQCDYGVGYEQPLRVELVRDNVVVATAFTAGTYMGEASRFVALYADDAPSGRYTIRFGRCPSMVTDPRASVACTDVDWFAQTRARLRPDGLERPQRVRYYRVRARCLAPDAELGADARRAPLRSPEYLEPA